MAKKQFTLNTSPHEAEIGDVTLRFVPEVMGDEFLDHYTQLQETTKRLDIDLSDMTQVDVSQVRETKAALRQFLANLMLPDSSAEFAAMTLPDRVLVELLEWVVELYGGGTRPSGLSSGSAPASPSPGTSGKVASRSRASMSTRGR